MKLWLRLRDLVAVEDKRTSSVTNVSETSQSDISISHSKSDVSYYPSDGVGSSVFQTFRFH